MWRWIKRWRDWAMRELFWPLYRNGGPKAQGIHFSYEKAGLLVRNELIPWNADAVLVEALIRFPSNLARRKTDFQLRLQGQAPLMAVTLHRHEEHDLFRLQFRLPVLRQTTTIELYWRSYLLGQAVLPLLSPEAFLEGLTVQSPTLFTRLGSYTVPCQSVIGTQCRGLLACGLLSSPTSLAPLIDMDLSVVFTDHRSEQTQAVPVRLISSQLSSNQALVTVVPERRPRRLGVWSASWTLSGRVLARGEVRILSQRTFRRSLYLVDSRYIYQDKRGTPILTRHLPKLDDNCRVGPCFLIASKEPGLAALCPLAVRVQFKGTDRSPALLEQEVLVTDGPSLFMPGTISAADLQEVTAFELLNGTQVLGLLSMSPAPVAGFTSEGGFKLPDDYTWNTVAEEELTDRMSKLMEIPLE
jgi:hypothetical protein